MENSAAVLPQPQRETEPEPEPENIDLQEFPEDLIYEILCFATPRQLCRLSALSKLFSSLTESDIVWSKFLPRQCEEQIISKAVSPIAFSSKKELYFRLCDSIMIDGGTKMVWMERSTAKVGCMLSARALTITWGDTPYYWSWVSREDSRFSEIAELLDVCWLEIRGRLDCRLLSANTQYRVVFVLKLGDRPRGPWNEVPVKFSVTTPDGQVLERTRMLGRKYEDADHGWPGDEDLDRYDDHGWLHLVVAKFTVKADGGYDNSSPHLEFSMEEFHDGRSKSGLLIDGVRIEHTDPNITRLPIRARRARNRRRTRRLENDHQLSQS